MNLKFKTKPWKHQMEALRYLMPRKYGALYTDMGSGKTKIIIDLITNRGFSKTLIVAPKKVCKNVWPGEFEKHGLEGVFDVIDVSNIPGNRKAGRVLENGATGKTRQQVVICNYDSIWRKPFKDFILKYRFDCVICDESHRIKSPGSKVSRFLTQLGKRVDNRFLMSGTPLAQSPLDIYAQYRFLNPEIFGTRFDDFKYQFANWITIPGGFTLLDKNNPYKNLDELHKKMFSCAFLTEANLDLPEVMDILYTFDMPSQTQKYYKEFQKEGVLELSEGVADAGNILAIITRLQQLSSGYLPVEDEENQKKTVRIDNARQEVLKELLEGMDPEEPVVVFAKFVRDIKNIRKVAKELGRKSSELSGRRDTYHNWKEGKTQILAVQIASGAEGLDFTRARYGIYYTLDQRLWLYQQSRKRLHRPGQTRPIIFYHLISKMSKGQSMDEKILHSLETNEDIIEAIMEQRDI